MVTLNNICWRKENYEHGTQMMLGLESPLPFHGRDEGAWVFGGLPSFPFVQLVGHFFLWRCSSLLFLDSHFPHLHHLSGVTEIILSEKLPNICLYHNILKDKMAKGSTKPVIISTFFNSWFIGPVTHLKRIRH